jgi:biopolymer transport protein ExbD
MKTSLRAKRVARSHSRNKQPIPLNLVPLIDIFTVLVFFLLANFGDVTLLSEAKNLELPQSVSEQKAAESLVVVVSRDMIMVAGQPVVTLSTLQPSEDLIIPELRSALQQQAAARATPAAAAEAGAEMAGTQAQPLKLTILGDKGTPYTLLKRVMATCTDAGISEIALAVTPRGTGDIGAAPALAP